MSLIFILLSSLGIYVIIKGKYILKLLFITIAIITIVIITVYYMAFVFLETECREETIYNEEIIINKKEKTIKCDPKLFRDNMTACLLFILDNNWELAKDYKSILLTTNNKKIDFIIKIYGDNNKIYTVKSFGSNSLFLCAFFKPEIPKNIKIEKITLESDHPITVKKIIWRDKDYL